MNNFQVNLLNLLHCFSEIHERLEKKEETDLKKKTINYYDYMSAFFSIYLDISLELSSKLEYKKNSVFDSKKIITTRSVVHKYFVDFLLKCRILTPFPHFQRIRCISFKTLAYHLLIHLLVS